MKTTKLSEQAINSINLYRGNNPFKIEILLNCQKTSVVNELKEYFHAKSISELAFELSIY